MLYVDSLVTEKCNHSQGYSMHKLNMSAVPSSPTSVFVSAEIIGVSHTG